MWKTTFSIMLQLQVVVIVAADGEFSSVPQDYDSSGFLVACVGDHISISCSHNNLNTGATRWTFTSPLMINDCGETIDHNPPISSDSCGSFMFTDVSALPLLPFNSTARATASVAINGTTVECRDGGGILYEVIGNITLCIIDKPQAPANVSVTNTTDRVQIDWDPIPNDSCGMSTTTYHVIVRRVGGGPEGDILPFGETSVVVSNLLLNHVYIALVTALTTSSSCTIASDPATTEPFTPPLVISEATMQPDESGGLPIWIIPTAVCSGVIITAIVLLMIFWLCCRKSKVLGNLRSSQSHPK